MRLLLRKILDFKWFQLAEMSLQVSQRRWFNLYYLLRHTAYDFLLDFRCSYVSTLYNSEKSREARAWFRLL